MEQEMYIREGKINPVETPQPLYAYAVGSTMLPEGEEAFNHGIRNQFIELNWSLSGIGEIEFYGQKFEMREDDVFLWLPGEDHRRRAISREWHCRWLCFDGPLAEAILLSYRFPRHLRACSPCPTGLFEDIERNINLPRPQEVGRLAALILEILSHLRRSRKSPEPLLERCVDYIKTHYDDPDLCIGTLCDVFHVPRSTLTKLFADDMQRSLGNYIRDTRYGNALALLRSTDLPFAEVARRCGYANHTSFCRLIHRATGVSPSAIRERKHTLDIPDELPQPRSKQTAKTQSEAVPPARREER